MHPANIISNHYKYSVRKTFLSLFYKMKQSQVKNGFAAAISGLEFDRHSTDRHTVIKLIFKKLKNTVSILTEGYLREDCRFRIWCPMRYYQSQPEVGMSLDIRK